MNSLPSAAHGTCMVQKTLQHVCCLACAPDARSLPAALGPHKPPKQATLGTLAPPLLYGAQAYTHKVALQHAGKAADTVGC
jgi:hypothetical protein